MKRYRAVINRYHTTLVCDYDNLRDAFKEYDSEEHFFIGIVDSETYDIYLPVTSAIGYTRDAAVADIEHATGLTHKDIRLFEPTENVDTGVSGWSIK